MMPPPAPWRMLLAAGFVVGGVFVQSGPARSATLSDIAAPSSTTPSSEALLTHSAAKAATFNIANLFTNFVIFSAGTGSIVGGGVLAAFNITKSVLLYTANEYAWDAYFPVENSAEGNDSFDAVRSLWRTTGKFLTYKPVSSAIKFTSIFLYTGSLPIMVVYGTASEVVGAGVFYINGVAWDLYDWSQAPSESAGHVISQGPHPAVGRGSP